MNDVVRTYLIQAARQKDKFVNYSDVVNDCDLGLDLSTDYGRNQLSTILADVSVFENEYSRPLLSSLAIYKDLSKNDHGDGFYKLAEKLGRGSFKKLKDDLFAFTEADRCRQFWQVDHNFSSYGLSTEIDNQDEIAFFEEAELDFFKKWQLQPYDPNDAEHVEAKDFLMNTIWTQSIYLGKRIVEQLPGFSLEAKKIWHKLGSKEQNGKRVHAMQFKNYTWVKIFRNTDRGRQIYFTFGVDAHKNIEAFIYKIDCQRERGTNFNQAQIDLIDSLVPTGAKWNEIPFEELIYEDWNSLTDKCISFVKTNLAQYDAIVNAVWGAPIPAELFKNKLIRKDKPVDGFETIPDIKRDFKGVDIDYEGKAKEQKDLGDAGEILVKQNEIDFLKSRGLHAKADLVEIVQDGKGYDVLSFDEHEKEKYIEVKTTTGNEYTPFYLSENEIEFMILNQGSYCIYRVYNYDQNNNFGEYFELGGNVESQILMKPIQFRVLLKKENN